MKRTPLYENHVASGARIVAFGGWEMPIQYPEGIIHEVRQTRTNVGIFDVSHMARLEFTGPDAAAFLDAVLSYPASALTHGRARYHVICNEQGGIIDDAIIYKLEDDRYLLIVNAGNADTDREWLLSQLDSYQRSADASVEFKDLTNEIAMIAVQGPNAVSMLDDHADSDLGTIRRYRAGETTLDGERILAARTGYTGEDGFEIMLDSDHVPAVWELLKSVGAAECGLGARDVLRLEAGMLLHGTDVTDENNPYEAGIGWTVKANRPEYVADAALAKIREEGNDKRIAGFVMKSRGIARHGHSVSIDGNRVGAITSGTHSPTLNAAIAIGYIETEHSEPGTLVQVDVRGRSVDAEIVDLPFYRPSA